MPHHRPHIAYSLPGYKTLRYEHVTSTNDVAKEIAKNSQEENVVVIASTQTRGRGRQRRQWISPFGGVWLSILLRPRIAQTETAKLTLIAASAVAGALKDMLDLETEVKWPNDVLVDGKKLSGILAEACIKGDTLAYVVIGIGVNTNIALASFPTTLRKSVTTLRHELGYTIDNECLVAHLLRSFNLRYTRLQQGKWDDLRREWERRAKFIGKQVEVASFGEVFVGEALGIDRSGALVIRLKDKMKKRILVGDVTLR